MAESMKGLHRTARCAELGESYIGKTVCMMGWVQKSRNKGGLIFTDLRDRSGILQILFEENECGAEVFEKASKLRAEFVIAVEGELRSRGKDANASLATGSVELVAKSLRILAEAETPPFPIEEDSKTKEDLRLKYRYLDLRRPDLAQRIMTRARLSQLIRAFLSQVGFLEIETPTLIKSTPEGARDFLVPSRLHQGSFYALPQSPQLLKQLLMVSGMDRYFQLARCYRDEDLRADRQPEFTQVDMELSFVDMEDVLEVNERLLQYIFKEICQVEIPLPLQRMTWIDAMENYGSDKPDLRFDMHFYDISDLLRDTGFKVFRNVLDNGGIVKAITVKGDAAIPRRELDGLVDYVGNYGAKGLAWIGLNKDGSLKCQITKFLGEDKIREIGKFCEAENGDLILIIADKPKVVAQALGELRLEMARRMNLIDENEFCFRWVTDFPMFEYSEEDKRWVAEHHPFTAPRDEDVQYLLTDPSKVYAKAYDMVLNGVEAGGGSLRIYQEELQEKVFKAIGITHEEAQEKFGFLLDAFRYGAPPHAGIALGLDRLVMLMLRLGSIRDVIAFPKTQSAIDQMTQAPSEVVDMQLKELHIRVDVKKEKNY